jgi:hypothetical protein
MEGCASFSACDTLVLWGAAPSRKSLRLLHPAESMLQLLLILTFLAHWSLGLFIYSKIHLAYTELCVINRPRSWHARGDTCKLLLLFTTEILLLLLSLLLPGIYGNAAQCGPAMPPPPLGGRISTCREALPLVNPRTQSA